MCLVFANNDNRIRINKCFLPFFAGNVHRWSYIFALYKKYFSFFLFGPKNEQHLLVILSLFRFAAFSFCCFLSFLLSNIILLTMGLLLLPEPHNIQIYMYMFTLPSLGDLVMVPFHLRIHPSTKGAPITSLVAVIRSSKLLYRMTHSLRHSSFFLPSIHKGLLSRLKHAIQCDVPKKSRRTEAGKKENPKALLLLSFFLSMHKGRKTGKKEKNKNNNNNKRSLRCFSSCKYIVRLVPSKTHSYCIMYH